MVFGQGSVLGIETSFLPGVAWLAGRLGWPVLPVATAGGHRVWEWPFSARLRFGQPMAVDVLPTRSAADLDLVALQAEVKAAALASGAP
ncbi:MAG: hypothetical protein OEO77_12790 [Acidimicrobiia bacterium]|nr:hypothetical protein [Acidimicrobiia bacterium]